MGGGGDGFFLFCFVVFPVSGIMWPPPLHSTKPVIEFRCVFFLLCPMPKVEVKKERKKVGALLALPHFPAPPYFHRKEQH